MSRFRNIHQMLGNAGPGNSISAGARMLRAALRRWGYHSEIYAESVAPSQTWGDVFPFAQYRSGSADLLVFHYSHASALSDYVKTLDVPLLLVYHNVTPPEFFAGANPEIGLATRRGRAELPAFRERALLALAVSEFNRRDLVEAGYSHVDVLPVIAPDTLQHTPPDQRVLAGLENSVNLLCVGRVVPNKRYEDVIKVLFYYRQIEPRARLFLVGQTASARPYVYWLHHLINWLSLSKAVTFTRHVSDAALAAYYGRADVFIYMSEHEGFGIPLVESMRMGVPIIAYNSSAVPETLGGAGILVRQKHYPLLAELIHLLQTDAALRARIIARQKERAQDLDPARILERFKNHLDALGA